MRKRMAAEWSGGQFASPRISAPIQIGSRGNSNVSATTDMSNHGLLTNLLECANSVEISYSFYLWPLQ
jgi:hypothetical protein